MKRPSSPPWRHGSLALVLLVAASCSPISVEQRDYTISRHVTRLQSERAPDHDRLEVRGHLDGNIAVVEVAGNLACLVRDSETRVERRDTIRRAKAGVVVLEVVGLGVGGLAFSVAGVVKSIPDLAREPEEGSPSSSDKKPAGANLMLVGAVMELAAAAVGITEAVKAKDSSEERTETTVGPARVAPCDVQRVGGQTVSLVARGVSLAALADEHGVARIPIDEASWERCGGVLDAEVRLDGGTVGRIRLVRPAK